MEQGLSFIVVIGICSIMLLHFDSQIGFAISFIVGSLYLLIRGKRKGWSWKR